MRDDPSVLIMEWNVGMAPYPEATEIPGFSDVFEYDFGIHFRKGSEFTELFGFHMSHMLEVGLEDVSQKKWLKRKQIEDARASSQPQALGFETLSFPFSCVLIGFVIATPLLLIEKATKRTVIKSTINQ